MRLGQRFKKGIAIVMALTIMMLLLTLGLGYLFVSRRQVSISMNHRDALKAFYFAEAGIEDAIDQLIADDTWRTGFTDKALADGTYTVALADVAGSEEVTVTSTGSFEAAERTVVANVVAVAAFSYAQQASGTVAGGVGDADFTGSTGTITGDIMLGGEFTQGSMNVTGTITEGVAELIGYEVNMASYEADADTVIDGNYTFTSGPPHIGVYYVTGDAVIEDGARIIGTIVVAGNVTVDSASADITIAPAAQDAAIIAGNDIDLSQMDGSNIQGVVYADNDIDVSGSSDCIFKGGLMYGNTLDATDCSNMRIQYFLNPAIPPPYFIYYGQQVQVVTWQGHP